MGCWTSKGAVTGNDTGDRSTIPDQGHSPAEVAPPPDSASNGTGTNGAVEPSAVEVDVHELEARDSVSQLAERPRQIQFGEVTTHSYEQPPIEEAHSHLLLQKSLPQIPVDKVDLETRVGCIKGALVLIGVLVQLRGADRRLAPAPHAGGRPQTHWVWAAQEGEPGRVLRPGVGLWGPARRPLLLHLRRPRNPRS